MPPQEKIWHKESGPATQEHPKPKARRAQTSLSLQFPEKPSEASRGSHGGRSGGGPQWTYRKPPHIPPHTPKSVSRENSTNETAFYDPAPQPAHCVETTSQVTT